MYSSKFSHKSHHTYRGGFIGSYLGTQALSGIKNAVGPLGGAYLAYKGFNGLKSLKNWTGTKLSNVKDSIFRSNTYNKAADLINPNRGLPPAQTPIPAGVKQYTKMQNGEGSSNLLIKGHEAPAINSDPFNKYKPDITAKGGFSVVGKTKLGSDLKNNKLKTDEMKSTNDKMNQAKSIDNLMALKPGVKKYINPDLNPEIKLKRPSAAQLLLDRLGKGLKRPINSDESDVESTKEETLQVPVKKFKNKKNELRT